MKSFSLFSSILFVIFLSVNVSYSQCGTNTQLGATSACGRSGVYSGQINPACGSFNNVSPYSPGTYFQVPVLQGGCYSITTCGAAIDTHIECFQANNTTGPFAWCDDNGPLCTGTSASLTMSPAFTDYARIDVRQYNCQSGGSSSVTVGVRQDNNLAFTSGNTAMCEGQVRALTATPARVTVAAPAGAGDVGTFTGTGVSGTNFTAPTPAAASQVYTITYTFGYCSTTQNITVYRNALGSITIPSQIICTSSLALGATATYGTGTWTASNAGVTFSPNATTANATANNLPVGNTTLTWTVTNGPCSSVAYSIVVTRASGNGSWIGVTSTDWNTASNWCGGVPTTTTDVLIPDASLTAFDPHVTVPTAVCRDITLDPNSLTFADAGQTLTVYGNWNNNSGSPTNFSANSTSTIVMNSNTAALGGTTASTFGNFTNSSPVGITVNQTSTVTNTLTMNGNFTLNSTLILGTSPSSTGTLTMGGIYLMTGNGFFRRYFSNTVNSASQGLFPLGQVPGAYRRDATLQFTIAPTIGGYIEGRFVPSPLSYYSGLPLTDAGVLVQNYMNEGYWELNPGGGITGGIYSLQLQYDGIATITNPSNLRILKSPGPAHILWVADGTHGVVSGTVSAGYVTRNNVNGFSYFVISSNNANPLPIELQSFTLSCDKGTVAVNWVTSSEVNNDYFVVEKSTDGVNWMQLGRVEGAGNSNVELHYMLEDDNISNGISYYRLIQTDYNGTKKIYDPAVVSCYKDGNNVIVVYPNPANEQFTVAIEADKNYDDVSVNLSNMLGVVVYQTKVQLKAGKNQFIISPLDAYPAGSYLLNVYSGEYVLPVQKILIH